ncbi:MAG: hypothetical protein ACXADB_07860 [Candidatus Hermodarchaeia archaeon]|jgi:hypothetical protein
MIQVDVKPFDWVGRLEDFGKPGLQCFTYIEFEVSEGLRFLGRIQSAVFFGEPDEWDEKIEQAVFDRIMNEFDQYDGGNDK